jgi:hypothetical protein
MTQAYAIAYRSLDGSVRCIYKSTKSGAVNAVSKLVGVEPLAITCVANGKDIAHQRIQAAQ